MGLHTERRMKLKGRWEIGVRRDVGGVPVTFWQRGYNLVVDAGLDEYAKMLAEDNPTPAVHMSHMAIGDSGAALDGSQTDLQGTTLGPRVALVSKTAQDNEVILACQITAVGDAMMREAGIFSALTGGVMFARWLTQAFQIYTGDVIDITWTLPLEG